MKVKKFLEEKAYFLGCNFTKIKFAFVAESYATVSQNIQTYVAALQLNARFDDAAAKPQKMLARE